MATWWGLVLGCTGTIIPTTDRCSLEVGQLASESGRPGDTVLATGGGPFRDERDTAVFVGGVRASVVSVNGGSTDCLACQACKSEAECSLCGTCDDPSDDLDEERRQECFATGEEPGFCARCEPSVEFVVPDLPAGPTEVWVIGEIGTSRPVPFTIEAGAKPVIPTGSTGDTGGATP